MSALNVPHQPTTSQKTVSRSNSAGSLRRSAIDHEDNILPTNRSRRNSDSAKANIVVLNAAPIAAATAQSDSGQHLPLMAQTQVLPPPVNNAQASNRLQPADTVSSTVNIYAGKQHRQFTMNTRILQKKSPFFKKLLAEDSGHGNSSIPAEQTTFEDLDESAVHLFALWLIDPDNLYGLSDVHATGNYLALYVLGVKFEVEQLQNQGEYCNNQTVCSRTIVRH